MHRSNHAALVGAAKAAALAGAGAHFAPGSIKAVSGRCVYLVPCGWRWSIAVTRAICMLPTATATATTTRRLLAQAATKHVENAPATALQTATLTAIQKSAINSTQIFSTALSSLLNEGGCSGSPK